MILGKQLGFYMKVGDEASVYEFLDNFVGSKQKIVNLILKDAVESGRALELILENQGAGNMSLSYLARHKKTLEKLVQMINAVDGTTVRTEEKAVEVEQETIPSKKERPVATLRVEGDSKFDM